VLLHLRDGLVRAMGGAQPSTKALEAFMSPRRVRRLLDEFEEKIESHIRRTQVEPVIDAMRALPKDELAAMAEALVNLTSFKRRVSMEEETVGGPIDVAVISKGDGFVWIKRKHYFRPELNPRYFRGLPGRS